MFGASGLPLHVVVEQSRRRVIHGHPPTDCVYRKVAMSTQVVNTKIEAVCEAIEDLCIASAENVAGGGNIQNALDARAELKHALTEFLKPILQVTPRDDNDGPR
jgi:hypothetical protein